MKSFKIGKKTFTVVNFETELTAQRYDFAMAIVQSAIGGKDENIEAELLKTGAMTKLLAALVYTGKSKKFSESQYNKTLEILESEPIFSFGKARSAIVGDFLNFVQRLESVSP